MAHQVIEMLALKPGATFVDCTLGGAGHTVLAAELLGTGGTLIGIDEDPMAIEAAGQKMERAFPDVDFRAMQGDFAGLDSILCQAEVPGIDAILFDLGLSSPQIDFPERGFSYKEDAPLDMRRNSGKHTKTAAEVIAT